MRHFQFHCSNELSGNMSRISLPFSIERPFSLKLTPALTVSLLCLLSLLYNLVLLFLRLQLYLGLNLPYCIYCLQMCIRKCTAGICNITCICIISSISILQHCMEIFAQKFSMCCSHNVLLFVGKIRCDNRPCIIN